MNITQQAKGFTLIEMIMVMVVLGVLVAITASRWNATDATAGYQADLFEEQGINEVYVWIDAVTILGGGAALVRWTEVVS